MADSSKTDAEAKVNADQIEDTDATAPTPRGNVISEAEDQRQHEPPPPLPH